MEGEDFREFDWEWEVRELLVKHLTERLIHCICMQFNRILYNM